MVGHALNLVLEADSQTHPILQGLHSELNLSLFDSDAFFDEGKSTGLGAVLSCDGLFGVQGDCGSELRSGYDLNVELNL